MNPSGKIRFGDFEADLRFGELRKHGYRVRLQEKPFQVLAAIVERAGELVTREELHQRLWGSDTFVDFDNNLNTAVYKLREALGDTAETPRYIETWPKKGYRFIGAIENVVAPVAAGGELNAPATAGAGADASRPRLWRIAAAFAIVVALIGGASYLAIATSSGTASANSGNPVAQEAYLKGRYFMEKGGAENLRRAAAYFEQSIANDPGFARAHAELADALAAYPAHRRENPARAKAAALKAVELDPRLAQAHHRLASIYLYEDWNWAAAAEAFARAERLAPESAPVRYSYAGYFSAMGQHDRALEKMQQAMRLDPVSVAISADTGWYWFVARRYDEALAQSKKALELDAQHRGAHYYILLALLAKGETVEARQWAAKYLAILGGTPAEIARVTSGEASAGLREFWRIRLARAQERVKMETVPAQELALIHASLGDTEQALAYLEKAYEEHSGWLLPFMRVYPPLDALRTQPRFQALQSNMNFPSR